jgi:hypothetical protein
VFFYGEDLAFGFSGTDHEIIRHPRREGDI